MVVAVFDVLTAFAVMELYSRWSIFGRRALFEAWRERNWSWRWFLGKLLTCRFCLGTWICLLLSLANPIGELPWYVGWWVVRSGENLLHTTQEVLSHGHQNDTEG